MNFQLTSTAFEQGQHIPRDYTADGRNASPPLKWFDPPQDTQSFALICEDPDTPKGTLTHWVIFNLPAEERELSEGIIPQATFPNGIKQGKNAHGDAGYIGPAPPPGMPHRYFFKLFALDRPLGLEAGASKEEVLAAMNGHILAQAQLMGTYGKGEGHELTDDPIQKKAEQDRASIYTAPLS